MQITNINIHNYNTSGYFFHRIGIRNGNTIEKKKSTLTEYSAKIPLFHVAPHLPRAFSEHLY